MTKMQETLSQQFQSLTDEGRRLNQFIEQSGRSLRTSEVSQVASWLSRAGALIKNVASESSMYYQHFDSTIKGMGKDFYNLHSNYYAHFSTLVGCLEGVYNDFKNGLLQDVQSVLRAEIFGDFIEMAEYLLNEGYKDAAAVILGAVLEDSLRKLAVKNHLETLASDGSPKNLDHLNQDLYKADVYDKLIHKQTTSWGDLRNKAAHGEFDKYDAEQVHMMLLFVQKFSSDYLR
jgi:hypothetical protein